MGVEKIRRRLSTRLGRFSAPTVDAALTQVNMLTGATGDGDVRIGYSGATIQFGFVANGTAYILTGEAGGTVTLGTAPAS